VIQLRMLGSVELRAGDGREIRDALVQPKRLALLVYLATPHPGTFHRRDSLVALFWPELSEPRARDALKQAISYLRRSLASADDPVILNRGADELALSIEALSTDVNAFEAAVEDGRFAEALDIYRGDLLEGFSSDASNDFEDWIGRERGRLRALAAVAAQGLAENCERAGDIAAALSAARSAVALSELEEPVFRKLLRLLDRSGDRVGAIRAYEALVARLATEYDTVPAAETRQLMEEIRTRQTPHTPSLQRESSSTGASNAPPPLESPLPSAAFPVTRRAPVWPRIWIGAIIGASLTTVGALAIFRPGGDAGLNPKRMAVAPFINLTGDSTLNVLGPLIAEGVTRGLEQLDSVEVVSSQVALMDTTGKIQKLTDLGALTSVGEQARAGRVVGGSYSRQGDTLRLQTRIVNARTGQVESALDPVTGSVVSPYAAIERVRDAVATSVQASRASSRIGSIGHLPTLAAFSEFLNAWELGVESERAEQHLIRAARLDTTFTLAQYWLADNYSGTARWKAADSLLNVLSARRDGFSPVEQELFAETEAYVHHDWERDLRASRNLLKRDSTSTNAGGVALVALNGNRPREVIKTLQAIPLTRVPTGNRGYWNKMALANHMLGQYEAELVVATTGRSRLTGPFAQVLLLEKQTRALAALGRLSALRQKVDSFVAAWSSRAAIDSPPPFLTIFTNPAQNYEHLALELYAHGQRDEALVYVRKGLEWQSKNARNADTASTDSLQFWLARLLMLAGQLDSARAIWTRLAPRDTLWAGARIQLAIVAARQRDTVVAMRTVTALDSLARLPFAFGEPTVRKARIAAALGLKDDAVRFLKLAMREGRAFDTAWHSDADFQSLQDYEPFKLLLRPAG
jgi:DNA-binding SARP family transcriptional activator/TolB-like protein